MMMVRVFIPMKVHRFRSREIWLRIQTHWRTQEWTQLDVVGLKRHQRRYGPSGTVLTLSQANNNKRRHIYGELGVGPPWIWRVARSETKRRRARSEMRDDLQPGKSAEGLKPAVVVIASTALLAQSLRRGGRWMDGRVQRRRIQKWLSRCCCPACCRRYSRAQCTRSQLIQQRTLPDAEKDGSSAMPAKWRRHSSFSESFKITYSPNEYTL